MFRFIGQIKLECTDTVPSFAVTGFSAELWQVQEVQVSLFGTDRRQLFTTTIAVEPTSSQFVTKQIAIPVLEPVSCVMIEISKGTAALLFEFDDFQSTVNFSIVPLITCVLQHTSFFGATNRLLRLLRRVQVPNFRAPSFPA